MFSLLQIMAERKNAKALACSSLQERPSVSLDVPLQGRLATPAFFGMACQQPKGLPWVPGVSSLLKTCVQLDNHMLSMYSGPSHSRKVSLG